MARKKITFKIKKVNTVNLEVGKTYKNYKELCSVLGETPTSSDSKTAQLYWWDKYFEWERIGHGYKILSINNMPICFPRKRNKQSKYTQAAYPIIINALYKQALDDEKVMHFKVDFPTIINSRQNYFLMLGFTKNRRNVEVPEENSAIFNDLYDDYSTIMYSVFNSTIKNLAKTRNVLSNEQFCIYDRDDEEKFPKTYIANQTQRNAIMLLRLTVLSEMHCRNMFNVVSQNRYMEFCNRLNSILQTLGHSYCYQSTALEFSLSETQDNNIYKRYKELFGNMSQKEIDTYLYNCKLQINSWLIAQIYNRNAKCAAPTTEEYEKLTIDEKLEYHNKYRQKRNELTDKYLKIS